MVRVRTGVAAQWAGWLVRRLSGEAGQDVVEYAGVLVLVAAIIAAVASANVSEAVTHAVSCEIKQITNGGGGCTLAAAPVPVGSALGPANPSMPGSGMLGESQMEQALGSNELIHACAGNGRTELGSDLAAQSQACKQQLSKLSPKAISTLELLAALFQAEHDYKPGSGPPCTEAQAAALAPTCAETKQQFFELVLADYTQHPGDAVIALAREAQRLQSGPLLRNEKIESTPGDPWDGANGTATARQLGRQGESLVPGAGNTARVPSATGTANYRIPDILDPEARIIGEAKNVSRLSLTAQLRDFIAHAQEHGYDFELYIRRTTQLSGPLKQAVTGGQITLRYLP